MNRGRVPHDGLGSVRALTNASGNVVQTYGTDEFGVPHGSLTQGTRTQPFGYTGEQRDPTGLVNLRARLYDPQLGRFLQADPLRGTARNPCSLNRYAYVRNDPVTNVDPAGLYTCSFAFSASISGAGGTVGLQPINIAWDDLGQRGFLPPSLQVGGSTSWGADAEIILCVDQIRESPGNGQSECT